MRGFDLGGHFGQLERDRLMLRDRLAEGLAVLGVVDRELEGSNRDATGPGGDVDPPHLDAIHHLCEALAGRGAEDLVRPDAVAVEHQLGGVDAFVTHLVDLAGDAETRGDLAVTSGLVHQQRGQVVVCLRRPLVGLDQRCHQGRRAAIGQPHLRAVDDVAVAVAPGPRFDRRYVGTQLRFRHRKGTANASFCHARQVVLLLLVGAVMADHMRHDEVGIDHAGDAHPTPGDLLRHQRVSQQGLAQPAVFLGDGEAEQAHLLHPLDNLVRIGVGVLQFLGDRDDLLVHEGLHRGQDLLLDLGETIGLSEPGHEGQPFRRRRRGLVVDYPPVWRLRPRSASHTHPT